MSDKPKRGRPVGSLRGRKTKTLNLTLPQEIHDRIPVEKGRSKCKWGRDEIIKAVNALENK